MIDFEKLKQVVSDILAVDIDNIDENSSSDNIDQWDSLSHIRLVMAIEVEFKVKLTPDDMMDMLSVKLIKMILEEKIDI
jgi:acyl carrier protein